MQLGLRATGREDGWWGIVDCDATLDVAASIGALALVESEEPLPHPAKSNAARAATAVVPNFVNFASQIGSQTAAL